MLGASQETVTVMASFRLAPVLMRMSPFDVPLHEELGSVLFPAMPADVVVHIYRLLVDLDL